MFADKGEQNPTNLGPHSARQWKGVWRYFIEEFLDCCVSLEEIEKSGINFSNLACVARCNGLDVVAVNHETPVAEFRNRIRTLCQRDDQFIALCYSRKALGQSGDGHWSPLGAYEATEDMVLILDQARFKYNAHWVPLELLHSAMQTLDGEGHRRGYLELSRSREMMLVPNRFLSLSCTTIESFEHIWTVESRLKEKVKALSDKSEIVRAIASVLLEIFSNATLNSCRKDAERPCYQRAKMSELSTQLIQELRDSKTGKCLFGTRESSDTFNTVWQTALVLSLPQSFWEASHQLDLFEPLENFEGQELQLELKQSRSQLQRVLDMKQDQ